MLVHTLFWNVQPTMAPTPHRIAQTTSEVKKQYKKNGARIPERQLKQLERAHELDQRAARCRDADERRKAAKKKRDEREEKEQRARRQIGVGLATQLIGYSHTQAQLKNGMEAFLGVKQRKDNEQRRKNLELTKKLETIAQDLEKEPWDDDEADDLALDLPELNTSNVEQWVDDDLDDNSLLEAHDMIMSDPIVEAPAAMHLPPTSALNASTVPPLHKPTTVKPPPEWLQRPKNKFNDSDSNKLPEDLIELLSQDLSMRLPEWNPPSSLLHMLNPDGLPPHRLCVKVGSIVAVLRDLNTSSQLSKSQHLRVLRV
jgi:hypothetical protein